MNIKRSNRWFLFALIVPIILLLSMTVTPLITKMFGTDVAIETVPYDPADLLYGDYVDLQFEIQTVPKKLFDRDVIQTLENSYGEIKVYVQLEQRKGFYKVKNVTRKEPDHGVYLKGSISDFFFDDKDVSIDYNFQRYYVEENSGSGLEEQSRKGQLIAHLKVKDGYAILASVDQSGD